MNKNEILAKSRAENKHKDIASRNTVVVQTALTMIFFVTQILTGGGINWGAVGDAF